jgi:branched-chain amino acid transport system substrate-binding protein
MKICGAALSALVLGLAAAHPAAAQIRIGIAAPTTGNLAPLGQQIIAGVEAAVAEINDGGGLLSETVTAAPADDGCEASRGLVAADGFVEAGVNLVVGHLCSEAAIAAAGVYAAAGIIHIAVGAPDARFTEERAGAGVFRLFGRDDDQAVTLADFLTARPETDAIAVIDDRSLYGRSLAQEVIAALLARGREPALVTSLGEAAGDGQALVETLRQQSVDVVFIAGFADAVAALTIEMAEQDYDPLIVGGDALVDQAFADVAGAAADGVLFTYPPDPTDGPNALPALAAIDRVGGPSDGLALYAYAAVEVWARAVARTGTVDYPVVAADIAVELFETALGTIGFNQIGEVTLPGWTFYQWVDGNYAPVSP